MPRLRNDPNPPWRLPREGQVSTRTEAINTAAGTARRTGLTAIVPAPGFRPYRWRERPRRPVCSPTVAAMLALTTEQADPVDGEHERDPGQTLCRERHPARTSAGLYWLDITITATPARDSDPPWPHPLHADLGQHIRDTILDDCGGDPAG